MRIKNPTHEIIKAFLARKGSLPNDQLIESIAVEFGKDESDVRKVIVSFAVSRKKNPGRRYALDEYCFILLDGRRIDTCRELSPDKPRIHQPWKQIEDTCLRCSLSSQRGEDAILAVCRDLEDYFDRPAVALYNRYFKITSK